MGLVPQPIRVPRPTVRIGPGRRVVDPAAQYADRPKRRVRPRVEPNAGPTRPVAAPDGAAGRRHRRGLQDAATDAGQPLSLACFDPAPE